MREYDGFLIDDDFNIYNSGTGKRLTPSMGSDGYYQVQYRNSNGKFHHNRVHVIIAHCFIENPNNYRYVNHIDSDKTNNSLDNLEWCTNSYNVVHCWRNGHRTHKNNTQITVYKIDGTYIGDYKSIIECAKILRIDRHKIARVLKGESKKDYLGYLFEYTKSQETIESAA